MKMTLSGHRPLVQTLVPGRPDEGKLSPPDRQYVASCGSHYRVVGEDHDQVAQWAANHEAADFHTVDVTDLGEGRHQALCRGGDWESFGPAWQVTAEARRHRSSLTYLASRTRCGSGLHQPVGEVDVADPDFHWATCATCGAEIVSAYVDDDDRRQGFGPWQTPA